ncbi:ADP-ribosyl-(dinitrogen reductase) hydrolase [Ottowia pentelensis]|uniref:ADP-ribosyl-(Dinitrogen reductase) hydrolase n=1 Tax=Ottowia pentelensis TaxID=511108 RepID=A0ABV6PTD2_9BURK
MLKFSIAPSILKKLTEKHSVTRNEVEQCFLNRKFPVLLDDLEDHQTDPPSLFFIAYTNAGRRLKVVYIQKGPNVVIKTCFEPTDAMVAVYHQLLK